MQGRRATFIAAAACLLAAKAQAAQFQPTPPSIQPAAPPAQAAAPQTITPPEPRTPGCHDTTGPLPRPALAAQFADPFIYCAGSQFMVVASNWGGVHIPVAASTDLSQWTVLRNARDLPLDAMPELPQWVVRNGRPDIWAPEVARLNGRWVLYFSARHAVVKTPAGQPRECVGAAVGDRPEGPYRPEPGPLVCGGFAEGAIDPSYLQDGDPRAGGQGVLYVKSDGNCCRMASGLYAVPLTPDGLHLAGAIRPVNVANDRDWEGEIVEAPTMVKHDGKYVLFYSGGLFFTPAYGVAYATCEGPLGPCQKPVENRVLQTVGKLGGPGHQSVFEVEGRSYMAFHALASGGKPGPDTPRQLHVELLTWENGVPRLGEICGTYGVKDATGVQVACPGAPLPANPAPLATPPESPNPGSPSPAR